MSGTFIPGVNEAVFLFDTARPETGKLELQCFRFTFAFKTLHGTKAVHESNE
jgi:hypothetical protein